MNYDGDDGDDGDEVNDDYAGDVDSDVEKK